MTKKQPKAELAFLFPFKAALPYCSRGDTSGIVKVPLVVLADDGKPRNLMFQRYGNDGSYDEGLADLCVTIWVGLKDDDKAAKPNVIVSVEYKDAGTVEFARVEAMVKTVRRISKRLDDMERNMGGSRQHSETFKRIMAALQVEAAVRPNQEVRGMYTENTYRKADDAISVVFWFGDLIDEVAELLRANN